MGMKAAMKALFSNDSEGQESTVKSMGLSDLLKTTISNTGVTVLPFDYQDAEAGLEKTAYYNPWIAASIRAIVRNSTKAILTEYTSKNETIETKELWDLLNNPHPLFDLSKFVRFNVYYYNQAGISYNLKIRDDAGKLLALQPIPSGNITLNQSKLQQGQIEYIVNVGGKQVQIQKDEILIWIDDEYITGYYTGTSKLKHLLFSILNNDMADRYNNATFKNGGEMRGILSTDQKLSPSDIDLMEKQLKKRHGGPDNSGKTMILGGGLKYAPTGQTNSDMGYDQLKKITREEVIAIYKVPPVELGLTEASNYANTKEQRKIFWETSLCPMLDSFAAAITEQVVKQEFKLTTKLYFDYSSIDVLQPDLNQKFQTAMMMQAIGYNPETISEFLDIPKFEAPISFLSEPAPAAESTPEKLYTVNSGVVMKAFRDQMKSAFLISHNVNEKIFENQLGKMFLGQRNEILDHIKELYGMKEVKDRLGEIMSFFNQNIEKWNEKTVKLAIQYLTHVNKSTVKSMIEKYSLKFSDGIKSTLKINEHATKIKDINQTVNTQLYNNLKAAYERGITENNSVQEIAQMIVDSTKQTYKMAEKRALTIARTETTSAANDLFITNFQENGVGRKEWLTSQDDVVRSIANGADFDHAVMDGVVVDIQAQFLVPKKSGGFEGVDYPGDMVKGSAGNVINDRCTLIPD